MRTDNENSPVSDGLIGRLYRAPKRAINDLVSDLSSEDRGNLATFCYARAHLRDIGFAIAATCDLETLVVAGGIVGHFLFELSRDLPCEEKPVFPSKRAAVRLAPISKLPAEFLQ
jgi:hypothetical protein